MLCSICDSASHSALSMRILFAGIIARYPFGGVTWCSLMYLLGLRALGHEVFYIEDTGECVYDPVQNTRATDPGYGTTYIHAALEPFGLGDRWSFVNYDGTYHGRSADDVRRYAPTPICSSTSRADRGSGATSTRASRTRSSSTRIRRSRSSRSPRRSRGTSSSSSGSITCSRSARTSAPPASPVPTGAFTWHKTWQPITLDDWRTDAPPGDRFTTRHDLADRELHRRRRQQGPGVRQVHRSAVADAAALRARDQRTADSCCASTAGRPSTPWGCRERRRTTATSSSARRPSSASPSTPTWRPAPAGSAIAPSATSPSGRPALVQDTGWTAHLPSGEGLLAFSTHRRGGRRHRSHQQRLRPARRGARSRSRASTSTPRVRPAAAARRQRAHEPDRCGSRTSRRSRRRFRRRNRDRSRR